MRFVQLMGDNKLKLEQPVMAVITIANFAIIVPVLLQAWNDQKGRPIVYLRIFFPVYVPDNR